MAKLPWWNLWPRMPKAYIPGWPLISDLGSKLTGINLEEPAKQLVPLLAPFSGPGKTATKGAMIEHYMKQGIDTYFRRSAQAIMDEAGEISSDVLARAAIPRPAPGEGLIFNVISRGDDVPKKAKPRTSARRKVKTHPGLCVVCDIDGPHMLDKCVKAAISRIKNLQEFRAQCHRWHDRCCEWNQRNAERISVLERRMKAMLWVGVPIGLWAILAWGVEIIRAFGAE